MGGNGGEGDNRRVSLLSCSHVFHENCVRSLELFCLSSTSATVPAVSEVRHSCSSGEWIECGSDRPPILALISHLAPVGDLSVEASFVRPRMWYTSLKGNLIS